MTPTPPQAGERAEALDRLSESIWKDAERYRFLRDDAQYSDGWTPHVLTNSHLSGHAPEYLAEEELDAAIDAAIAALDSEESK